MIIIFFFNYFIGIRILQYDKLNAKFDNNDDVTENSFLYYVLVCRRLQVIDDIALIRSLDLFSFR